MGWQSLNGDIGGSENMGELGGIEEFGHLRTAILAENTATSTAMLGGYTCKYTGG